MRITLSIPKQFRGAIAVREDLSVTDELQVLKDEHVIVPVPASGELRVKRIPFSQGAANAYDAQWSDGTPIPDGTIQKGHPNTIYFYYMFVPKKDPREEYFFVGTPTEKDRFLQKASWTAL